MSGPILAGRIPPPSDLKFPALRVLHALYGVVWYGMVWYSIVWYGMVWYGMVWYGMVWYGKMSRVGYERIEKSTRAFCRHTKIPSDS